MQKNTKGKLFTGIMIHILLLSFNNVVAESSQRILLISSYNSSFPTYFQQVNGVKSILDSCHISIDLETLDSKRFNKPKNYTLFTQLLKYKIKNGTKYTAIITCDDNALNYALSQQDSLFEKTPIIFCGVNNTQTALIQNNNDWVTGVIEKISIIETINIMLQLFPEAKTIYTISDNTNTGKTDLLHANKVLDSYKNIKTSNISLSNQTFKQFPQQLKQIEKDNPVLLLSALVDKNGRSLDFSESLHIIKENLKAPLFHLYTHGLGEGVLGGKLVDHFSQGQYAANIVKQVIQGADIKKIKVENNSPNQFYFDFNELKRYHISTNELPTNSQIINAPKTLVARYKFEIYFVLAFMLLQSLLLIYLSLMMKQRKKTQVQLALKINDYISLNKKHVVLNKQYQRINEELRTKNNELLAAEEELLANNEELHIKNQQLSESEERYRLLFNNLKVGFALCEIIWDENDQAVDYIYIDANPELLKRVQLKYDEIVGKTAKELFPHTEQSWINKFAQVASTGIPSRFTDAFSAKGKFYDTHIFSPKKGLCGALFDDITDKKHFEIALKESEKRFKNIFNKSKTVMLIIDPKSLNIIDANSTACLFYGYSKDEIIALNVNAINQTNSNNFTEKYWQVDSSKNNYFKDIHTLKSGQKRNVDIFTSSFMVNKKRMVHVIVIDTTQTVQAKYQIQQVNKRFQGLENIIHYKASTINDLLDFTLQQIIEYTQSQTGAVYHYDDTKKIFLLNNYSKDFSLTYKAQNSTDEIKNIDCLNQAVNSNQSVIINNSHSNYPFQKHNKHYNSITIPVKVNGKIEALFWLASKTNPYSNFHAEQISLLLETAWILVEKQRLQDSLHTKYLLTQGIKN
jgi:PAS domain S-box-containing protein